LELRSQDGRFGLVLSRGQERLLRKRCSISWPNETGGILVGRYSERRETAVVTRLPPAPADSVSGRARFVRGLHGLQGLIRRLWNQSLGVREYYLGEWHCHPGQAPVPSPQDQAQMRAIANDGKWQCPEPVLVIIGGSPTAGWLIAARVYPRGSESLPLLPTRG
jgi:integrative and conjugative element protein (TIGR02256 family)